MRPTDEGGGGGGYRGGGAGGSGAPAARVLDLENPLSFTSLLEAGAQIGRASCRERVFRAV